MKIERGDIFFADLSPVVGSEIGGMRYVVVVQNDELNKDASLNGNTVIVAPLSSSNVEMGSHSKDTIVYATIPELNLFTYQILLFGIRAIDAKRLKNHIGRLDDEAMAELNKKIKYALGL